MRALLFGAVCAVMITPSHGQDELWNGFYAGVIGEVSLHRVDDWQFTPTAVLGYRHQLGNAFVVAMEGKVGYGFLDSYTAIETGAEAQVGMVIGGNSFLYGAVMGAYVTPLTGSGDAIVGIGAGLQYAMNDLATLRLSASYLIDPYFGVGSPLPSVRATSGVTINLN